MNHVCGRASSDKKKTSHFFNEKLGTDTICCTMNRFKADCKCLSHCKTNGLNKKKRLKTRKERSQMRGGRKEASKIKLHQHHCHRQSIKDMAHAYNCCQNRCHCPARRALPFPKVIPVVQEPSFITESRLIGHHGLFNHEVKSIDIERVLSEQGKRRRKAQQKNYGISRPSSASRVPSPSSSNDLLCAGTDEIMPLEREADPASNTHDKKEKTISHGSDVTPGQRPQQQLHVPSVSYKSIFSSQHSSLDEVIESNKANSNVSDKDKDPQLTPTVDRDILKALHKKKKRCMGSTFVFPKNQKTPAHGLSSSSMQLSSSPAAKSYDIQHRRLDPGFVSKSLSAMAARLCDHLQFPLMRTKRDLVAESSEVLLKALRAGHGPRFQKKLLEEWQPLSCGTHLAKAGQDHDQESTVMDGDELLPTDESAFEAATQNTTSFKMMGSGHFNWKPTLKPHQNTEQQAEWLRSPVDSSASVLDDLRGPSCSPLFCVDLEPSGFSVSDHLFASSPISCWGEKASASQDWENSFNRPMSKKSALFDSFENSFMTHTRAVKERRCGPEYDSNTQPFFPYQTQPVTRSVELMQFPQVHDPFETGRHSFAPSVLAQMHRPNQSNHCHPLSQFSHPSTSTLRSHHTDMMHYPPSHMLERVPAPPLSFLLSPKHWSFPPMKLY